MTKLHVSKANYHGSRNVITQIVLIIIQYLQFCVYGKMSRIWNIQLYIKSAVRDLSCKIWQRTSQTQSIYIMHIIECIAWQFYDSFLSCTHLAIFTCQVFDGGDLYLSASQYQDQWCFEPIVSDTLHHVLYLKPVTSLLILTPSSAWSGAIIRMRIGKVVVHLTMTSHWWPYVRPWVC